MFIPYEIFTTNCSGVRGLNTPRHVCPHRFQAFRLHLCFLCFLDFRRSDFAFYVFSSDISRSNFASTRLLQIRLSDFAFICIRCSDFICITFTSTAIQTFRLHLLQIKRLDFAFIWIRCLDFIRIILSSTADQTFKLCLLQIRLSNFAFIWIRCSDFICITFASIAAETFRFCLLQIRHSNFAFIWIRCSDFICIKFSTTAVQTSSSIDQTFRLCLHMDQMFKLHLH